MLTWLEGWLHRLGETCHKWDIGDDLPFTPSKSEPNITVGIKLVTSARDILRTAEFEDSAARLLRYLTRMAAATSGIIPLSQDGSAVCLQVTTELLSEVIGHSPPATDAWLNYARARGAIYIDIPQESFSVREYSIHAIFIQWWKGTNQLAFFVPVSDHVSGTHNVIVWPLGEPIVMGSQFATRNESDDSQVEVDLTLLARQMEDFAALVILYHLSGDASQTYLPSAQVERLMGLSSDKKQRNLLKKYSIFRVASLDLPPSRFGREARQEATLTWKLGQRIAVRGHFRWQAHGPAHSLRRLQWIDAYEKGPEDGERKTPLFPLRPNPPGLSACYILPPIVEEQ